MRLRPDTRNKVRAFLYADARESIKVLNKLRTEKSAKEILQIENVLRQYTIKKQASIPDLFPDTPQTLENFHRLTKLDFPKKIHIIDGLVSENFDLLSEFFLAKKAVDQAILSKNLSHASRIIDQLYRKYGYSHLLLRKAIFARSLNESSSNLPEIDDLLIKAGIERNNIIVTSLLHCYKEEQDFLNLKRSIMNLPSRGTKRKFTRDICRIPFHPLAKDESDLTDFLQSSLQSSLVDAVITAKANKHHVIKQLDNKSHLLKLLTDIELNSTSINDIASLYPLDDSESEYIFYKHSSAWLENDEIIKYRTLQDHFYNFPESDYFEITEELIERVEEWIPPHQLSQIAKNENLSRHNYPNLKSLEVSGNVTRSSIFNYCIYISKGYTQLDEADLISLMGQTRDLAKTINPDFLSTLAQLTDSKLSQLILHLLIARKSKNEIYDYRLRRIFQDIVIHNYDGKVVGLLNGLNKLSTVISEYTYEITTEDFLAKLFHIIKTASEITETRANLHKWMGQLTGEQGYLDRARAILIDHQLNKIRDEIDDNRIYVDSARFIEWVNDEVMREINVILTTIEHNGDLLQIEDPQLKLILERCYITFCSNNVFGIASYLGRRIRHGTFKGHLYSSVIKIERIQKYGPLLKQGSLAAKWGQWKREYEEKIDNIIRNRLHIESSNKREGLLKPDSNTTLKQEVLSVGAKYIAKTFAESKSSASIPQIIVEICWRLAEIDLKNINAFLKNQRVSLVNNHLLTDLKTAANANQQQIAIEFSRELVHLIDEKLMSMYNWFKRPINVSPKASLSLLYKAVVSEVKETFPDFETDTDFEPDVDIELIGSAYLLIYDAFYVIVYNAAKHGKAGENIQKEFRIIRNEHNPEKKFLFLEIKSSIKDDDTEEYVNQRLGIKPDDDITEAQVSEVRSGIRKLFHLEHACKEFSIKELKCRDRKVIVSLAYDLAA